MARFVTAASVAAAVVTFNVLSIGFSAAEQAGIQAGPDTHHDFHKHSMDDVK